MIIVVLVILGLALGSFVNAFVWRLHEGMKWVNERSECTNCHHKLAALDLIPIFSWLWLKGRCRYCKRSISIQYPIVELSVTVLFLISYYLWPEAISGWQILLFSIWLILTTGLTALALYDLRYMILPTKLIYALSTLAVISTLINIALANNPKISLINALISTLIGGGLFYILYMVSKGKWIGGGDVRLGFLLGLLAATPARTFLIIFIASLIGAAVSIVLMSTKHLKRKSLIPFGPFLIAGLFIVQFWGQQIINWYKGLFL